jgi:GNAT superfamily N-acetyltransferase
MESRDEAEAQLALAVEEETRSFLRQVLNAVLAAIRERRFDDAQPVLALGVMLGWWTENVSDRVVMEIRDTWESAFAVEARGGAQVSARSDAMAFHITAVKDRLSRSAVPEIPEHAFEQVRLSQSAAALGGWDTERQARDVAERLSWEPDKGYWEQQKAYAEARIDDILDPLGRPGTPARTYAHRNDPDVKVWQEVRAEAVSRIKEDEGDWVVRATRIARTESTAAWNSGALAALASEGRTHKKWVATTKGPSKGRTRKSHADADGQVVPLARPFRIGESLLMMPGDPAAPPWEVVNCRCTVVGADEPTLTALSASAASDNWRGQVRVPAGNGEVSGRWVDMPGKVIDDLADALAELGEDGAHPRIGAARSIAEQWDPANPGGGPALEEAAWELDNLSMEITRGGDWERELLLADASAKIKALNDTDWSLFEEDSDLRGEGIADEQDTDIGAGDDAPSSLEDLLGDHPVRPAEDQPRSAMNEILSPYMNNAGFGLMTGGDPEDSLWADADGWMVEAKAEGWRAYDADWNEFGGPYTTAAEAMQAVHDEKGAAEFSETRVAPEDVDAVIAATANAISEWREDATEQDLMEAVTRGMAARIMAASRDAGGSIEARPAQMDYDPWESSLQLEFALYDGGAYVGKIQRHVREEPEVYNAYFTLTEGQQGSGLGAAVTARLEEWYGGNGVERVTVQANIDVGGYTWAKMGFEPDPDHGDSPVYDAMRTMLDSGWPGTTPGSPERALADMWQEAMLYKISHGNDGGAYDVQDGIDALGDLGIEFDDEVLEEWREAVERGDRLDVAFELLEEWRQANYDASDPHFEAREALEGWATALADSDYDGLPSVWEISTFGQGTSLEWTDEDGRTMWPGKAALLGTNWHGVKTLSGGW